MKILAVNGSPKGPSGNTDILLQSFLSGAKEAGAEIQMIYIIDKKINHCKGCFSCMQTTPGICIQNDDMKEILNALQNSDVIVYATPLYAYTVSSLMKVFMDRNMPLTFAEPLKKKMALISTCGQPDRSTFKGLVETFKLMVNPYRELAGTILCTSGNMLALEHLKPLNNWYIEACKTAGRELVGNGVFSEATQDVLSRPLICSQA
ncbi:MAG: flavodoxin family protein [Solirubrobacterales bacterium]